MNPKVSVIMAVHNGEKYLIEAIESIVNQEFSDFEFIIINDGSNDQTNNIINSYNDRRIVYLIEKTNIGQTKALNKGIMISQGRFIARMDADDISLPKRLSRQVGFLEKNKDVSVVGSWHQEIDENGRRIRNRKLPTDPVSIKAGLITSSPMNWYCISHPTVMFRREAVVNSGLYNERYFISQDYELWIRISKKYLLANIPEILLKFRTHKDSLTRSKIRLSRLEVEDIIRSNISYYLPMTPEIERQILFNMLTFKRQTNRNVGNSVFSLFDKFYAAFMNVELKEGNSLAIRYSDVIKFLYSPMLYKTNKNLAIKIFFHSFNKYPGFIFSRRFASVIKHAFFKTW